MVSLRESIHSPGRTPLVAVSRSLLIHLPELVEIQRLAHHAPRGMLEVRTLAEVSHKDIKLPLVSLDFGSRDPKAPVFFLTAGVHGLERIGTRVVNSYLKSLISMAQWDETVHLLLNKVRFVVLPILNPVGMYLSRRSNGNGVDLMRNAPVEADPGSTPGIAGGHRISPMIPWFRGLQNQPMEQEAQVLCDFFQSEFKDASSIVALDVHSGFGSVDRIWFPYARSREQFPHLAEVYNLAQLLDRAYPHHIYKIEPQSGSYTTHGDLWDYLYDGNRKSHPTRPFIPLTLELGSWLWIKKNPRQLFSLLGIFNPLLPHRTQRILRRHILLLDYLLRASAQPDAWASVEEKKHKEIIRLATNRWYAKIA